MNHQTKFLLIAMNIIIALSGCSKSDSDNESIACTMLIQPAGISFNIVDAGTGADLFFANNPAYMTSQLCFLRKKNNIYSDTVKLEVVGTGTSRYFSMQIDNFKLKDTLVMKLPISPESLPSDVFAYTVKITDDRCPQYVLHKAFLNNEPIVQKEGKLVIKTTRTVINN